MKRLLRNLAFFLLGFFGVSVFMLSFAETINATNGTVFVVPSYWYNSVQGTGKQYSDAQSACAGYQNYTHIDPTYKTTGSRACIRNDDNSTQAFTVTKVCPSGYNVTIFSGEDFSQCKGSGYTCPAGQGWTLSGTQCTRPDCAAGTVRQADGSCFNKCAATANQTQTFFYRTATSPIGRTFCIPETGCEGIVSQATPQYDCGSGDILVCYQGFQVTAMSTPSACSSSTTSLPPTSSPVPANKPPCGADQGVLTSSSGKVACVPSGTPSASTPKVGSKTTTTQNADGSTTVNNTTTTCTGAGSCSSTTTTTVTSSSGQSSTTSKTTDSNSTNGGTNSVGATGGTGGGGGGGDAGCDPTVQMCSSPETAGLYTKKDKTFAGPLSAFTDGLKNSVLGQNATGFFTVSIPSGSCPNWSTSQSVMGRTFVVDFRPVFCSDAADKTMGIIGTVLMVVAAFGAFRWAIL